MGVVTSRDDCRTEAAFGSPFEAVSQLSLLWRWIWGKTDVNGISRARGGPAWNPLLAHCLDTAAVTGALFDRYLSANVRARLTEAFGGGCAATARRTLMFLTALHDMPGKAQPAFQRRFLQAHSRDPHLTAAAHDWASAVRDLGLDLDHWHDGAPHAHVTARYLPALLGCPCTATRPGTRPDHHKALHTIAALLGGHHGHIPENSRIVMADCALPDIWHRIHEGLRDELARILDIDLATLPGLIRPQRPSALVLFAGLVVHSDWLASNEGYFTYRTPDTSPDQWWYDAQQQADHAINSLHLTRWNPEPATWAQLMPAAPRPRPAQRAVLNAAPDGPALGLIELNTGGGKTETAWWLTHHLARTCGYHGFYIAQANRAASEQQISRAAEFLATSLGGRRRANLALIHGAASAAVTEELLDSAAARPTSPTSSTSPSAETPKDKPFWTPGSSPTTEDSSARSGRHRRPDRPRSPALTPLVPAPVRPRQQDRRHRRSTRLHPVPARTPVRCHRLVRRCRRQRHHPVRHPHQHHPPAPHRRLVPRTPHHPHRRHPHGPTHLRRHSRPHPPHHPQGRTRPQTAHPPAPDPRPRPPATRRTPPHPAPPRHHNHHPQQGRTGHRSLPGHRGHRGPARLATRRDPLPPRPLPRTRPRRQAGPHPRTPRPPPRPRPSQHPPQPAPPRPLHPHRHPSPRTEP